MKKTLLIVIIALLAPLSAYSEAPTGSATLWEKAAYGDIPGLQYIHLNGWNAAITTTFEVIWGESAAYTPQTAALSTPYCASSSANDAAAGTGARTISVKGADTAFTRFNETVTMNGTASVNLVTTNVLFIDSIEVLTAGSGLLNAGIIQCGTGANTAGDPAVTHQYLGVSSPTAVPAAGAGGGNISNSFMYAVPDNYKALCTHIQCGSVFATAAAGHECVIDGYTNSTGVMKRYNIQMAHNTGANPSVDIGYIVFPEKTIILGKMAGVTGSSTGPVSMSMDCLLIADAWKDSAQDIF